MSSGSEATFCGSLSASVHSRYVRSPRDVPAFGRGLIIRLTARRFRCAVPSCDRKTFAEQFAPEIMLARARRTSRLDCLVHCIGVVLGGRPGERLAERLSMPVSADTLLRTLRRRSAPTPTSIKIIGLDDFAWRRGHRYGTIVCDLEQRRIIDLLADREIGTVTAWLKDHPDIEIVCRNSVRTLTRRPSSVESRSCGEGSVARSVTDRRIERLRPSRSCTVTNLAPRAGFSERTGRVCPNKA
ncbi:transposase family protein [Lichenifustis flavocetrariae]|uniref:Transposase family protein n=1 Tax=Lichenifustis flavocetrariae TaxID=2949735 RepID=A0AA41Z4L5_9HYPH|nr:transposase family protein [Lichenifustis flavocetrariae]MCW6512911.1 transposase family protein [Lichenifustis flavocetrariae]